MVKVELVPDNGELSFSQEPRITEQTEFQADDDFEEVEEDDFDVNESLGERIVALKDAIPPYYRDGLAKSFGSTSSLLQSALRFGGKSLWVLSSSTLLLGVPLSLCILSEQQLTEMEKGMGITDSNDVLAGGADQGFAASPVA